MIQGYEDGTNKDETSDSTTVCEKQDTSSLATYITQHGMPASSEPPAKRPKLSPSVRPPGTPTTSGSPRTPLKNHASMQQFRGVGLPRPGQFYSPVQITGKAGGLPVRPVSGSSVQKNMAVSASVLKPGTVSEVLPHGVSSSTNLTQLLLSESPASKAPSTVVTCSALTKPSVTTVTQRLVVSSEMAVAVHGPDVASLLRQQVSSPASVMVVPSGDITSVHSYSLASASSSPISHGSVLFKTEAKPISSPSLLRTPPFAKRLRTVAQCDESSPVHSVMSQVVSCVARFSKVTKMNPLGSPVAENQEKHKTSIPIFLLPSRPKIRTDKDINNDEITRKRHKARCLIATRKQRFRMRYYEHLMEYFFLKTGGNMMDFTQWQKKPPSAALTEYLRANLYSGGGDGELQLLSEILSSRVMTLSSSVMVPITVSGSVKEQVIPNLSSVTNTVSSHSQSLVSRQLAVSPTSGVPRNTCSATTVAHTTVTKSTKQPIVSPKLITKHNSLSAVYDSSIGSQEEIVERAKQEAYVMQRIGDLRKEGLWSLKKLPKVQEPPRSKGHWDYLLEEMAWLATDFIQERKWKKAAAKKCSRMVLKHFQEKEMRAEKAEKEQNMRLRRIASFMAKEIRNFWANIEKLVEYKQQTWLDAKKKKVLDSHLNFIVDQTEKYSSWLTQGLNRQIIESNGTSRASSPITEDKSLSSKQTFPSEDEDFHPDYSESDNEETIDKEEANMSEYDEAEEIKLLKQESELTLENLLDTLPKEVLEKPASLLENDSTADCTSSTSKAEKLPVKEEKRETLTKVDDDDDDEFRVLSSDADDDEVTLMEQEEKEKGTNYADELKDLQDESELPIEELYEKYKDAYASDFEVIDSESSVSDDEMEVSADDNGESNMSLNNIDKSIRGASDQLEVKPDMFKQEEKNPSKEITDIAATAESFQPKGNTLSTTQVCTKIPFLLKHQLREYQHIGLDWLNAMYEKKLNGILADEMGLGKTIQTISILAHLACEKGIWGPHLIVVPTSVMLNWEMEIKKWCPAFKILTYYGTPKERKQKRIGWTKPNTFHICITSYKLVVQDHQSFRRKKWIYLILDEAQHIKNFKSQRWQMLLNFQSTHRLLLTGTPLQNSLMELWSLMHFLMPNVFQSHRDFREWFVNPVTGMIEGNHEYNESLIKRLHKVLRPFLLRRLKCEVEKQLPKKYEHVVICRLSKRQRYLYDDFMAQTKTKETLATGNFMSVINILMQLRKVCNHPNMFDPRPIVSPFMMSGITYVTASPVWSALDYDPFRNVSLSSLNLLLADIELSVTAFAAHRTKKFQTPPAVIEMIDSSPNPPPPVPPGKIRLTITGTTTQVPTSVPTPHVNQPRITPVQHARTLPSSGVNRALPPLNTSLMHPQRYMTLSGQPNSIPTTRAVSPVAAVHNQHVISQTSQPAEYTLQLLQQPSGGLPVAQLAPLGNQVVASAPFTVQIPGGARMPLSIGRLVQTSSGQHLLITPTVPTVSSESQPSVSASVSYSSIVQSTLASVVPSTSTTNVAMATVLPQVQKCVPSMLPSTPNIVATFTRPQSVIQNSSTLPIQTVYNKPIGRVAPMTVHPPSSPVTSVLTNQIQSTTKSPVLHSMSRSQPKPKLEVPAKVRVQQKKDSVFHLETLAARQAESRLEKLRILGRINVLRCGACPVYGRDLIEAVTVTDSLCQSTKSSYCGGRGYVNCLNAPVMERRPRCVKQYTKHLSNLIETPESYIDKLMDIIKRFVFVIPSVTAPPIQLHISHPPPSKLNSYKLWVEEINSSLSTPCALIHPIVNSQRTQFPELRLIEYDCGKLQRLSHLLYELKAGHHRVLIFTQMTRMLDILEQFLSYHGHTYLRLDGNTRVEQRQALMERFNADKRIFCFILSTRSGGIGVNLTGADTVIFYDSDWNPTMDAQAQDRCHRIGQTRDVHIYRLISERTVEENILKKANQKRMLGDLAIEGGNFTTAFFKKKTLHELFGIESPEEAAKNETSIIVGSDDFTDSSADAPENFSQVQLEQALGMAEEELDLQAAKVARDEAAAELAEFDESIPYDTDSRDNEEKSPAEEELERLMEQLTPIERYAVRFYESLQDPVSLEQLKQAEEEIEAQKRDWELGRLKALQEEQERRASRERLLKSDDPLLCYNRDNVSNQVFISVNGLEEMPMWAPPTPPQDDNDIYIDYNMGFMYEQTVMPESHLPPVFIKKENKRLKIDPVISATAAVVTTRKQKVKKDDITIPRSLFDRPSAAILKMRREAKLQRVKGLIGGVNLHKSLPSFGALKQATMIVNKPTMDSLQDSPEWLVHEDWAILQVIQNLQGLPLSLTVVQPAHVPNWDLGAESVNSLSRIYRSPRQCRSRYETVVVPREEGKILYDTNPKKQKKTKGIYKTKNNRPMRTSQLYLQDNNTSFTSLCAAKFDSILSIAKRRPSVVKQWYNQSGKSSRHATVLSDSGIDYDRPLTPLQLAAVRAERIAREKSKNQVPQATAQTVVQVAEQQLPVQRQQAQTQQTAVAVASTTNLMQQQAHDVIARLAHAQFQVTNCNATIAALASSNLRANQRTNVTATGTAPTITVQEMVAAAAGQVRGLTTGTVTNNTSIAPSVVSVAGLTAVQLQAASQRLTSALPATTVAAPLTQLSPQVAAQRNITQLAQLQSYRQNAAFLRQREQQKQQLKRLQAAQQQQAAQGVAGKVTVGSTGTTLSVAGAQQRAVQQQQQASIKQAVGRPVTEAEVAQLVKRQQQLQQQQKQAQLTTAQILAQAQLQQQVQQQQQQAVATSALQTSMATLVKTVSAPSLGSAPSVTIPVSAIPTAGVNITLPQAKGGGTQTKRTTLTNQQIRQLQLQQQLFLQAGKNSKVTNLSQLAKVQGKGTSIGASTLANQLNTVQIIQQGAQGSNAQHAKSLQTAMTVQIQQAMKQAVLPQTIPVVVSATPTLSASLQSQSGLRGEPGIAGSIKPQMTTLPSTTLSTSNILKGGQTVVVGQQQTAAILQQVAASSSPGLTAQQAVTLAVRAAASQAQGQPQVQIQVQQSPHSSLVAQQSQVVSGIQPTTQARIQQMSLGQAPLNITQTVPVQAAAQPSSVMGSNISSVTADSALQSSAHVVMQNVAVSNPQSGSAITMPTALSTASATAQVVQAAIQAARQQQQQAAQQQQNKASPYTMRLRNPK